MIVTWSFVLALVLAFIGFAMSVLGYSPPDFLFARLLIVMAAVSLVGMTTVWLAKNSQSKPFLRAIALYALSLAVLVGGLLYISKREAEAQNPTPQLGTTIGHDNNGNVCYSGASCYFAPQQIVPQSVPHSTEDFPTLEQQTRIKAMCPPGYIVLYEDSISGPYTAAIRAPKDAKLCIIRSDIHSDYGVAIELKN